MINSLVPSLELCRKLKDCGYPQEDSLYWWRYCTDGKGGESAVLKTSQGGEVSHGYGTANDFAAPLAEEILRRLPACLYIKFSNHSREPSLLQLSLIFNENEDSWRPLVIRPVQEEDTQNICGWVCSYESKSFGNGLFPEPKNSLSEAAADMYLHLAEHGLLPKESP